MDEELKMVLDEYEENLEKALAHLNGELVKIRAGKASPAMVEGVMVPYYGADTPLNQVANVSILDARTLTITPWEKSMIGAIEKAVRDANLGFNPQSDSDKVLIPIPTLTEERRKQLVKQAKAEGENARISIRSNRHDALDQLKELQKEGFSEDFVKRAEDQVQTQTDKYNNMVEEVMKAKEEEIMTV